MTPGSGRPLAMPYEDEHAADAPLEPADLVRAARGGDERAVERLYEAVRPRLLRIAVAMGVEPDAAADLVQESLWAAHRSLRSYDEGRLSFDSWLSVILVRRVRNSRRAAGRRMRFLDRWRTNTASVERPPQRAADARLTLERLLAELTERQREVIALYEIASYSAEEVAGVLELTPAGVRSLARDARRRLTEAADRLGRPEERPS
ncbi:MAG: RNA polymerase sigma factor [bacterium]|nr:RNA polymerase sigma factor [bacterium]